MAFSDWSTTPINNSAKPGINWAEGQTPDSINNSARQMMADLAALDVIQRIGSVKQLGIGAVGDDATDNFAAFTAAMADGRFMILPAGTYRVGTSITLSNVALMPGAIIKPANGVIVTMSKVLFAPMEKWIDVSLGGRVSFDWKYISRGYTEWWGAKADLSVDCYQAFMNSFKELLITQLNAGDYLVNSTPRMLYDHRSLVGATDSKYNDTVNMVSRVLIGDGASYGIQIGPDAYPGSINALQKANVVKDIFFARLAAPVIASNCVGVQVQWTLYAKLENVKVSDSMTGFRFYGTVTNKVIECESVRVSAGTGAGTDYWKGFWSDGGASIGAAGGNASLYYIRCAAGCNYGPLQTNSGCYGFYADQGFTDLFYDWPETVNCYNGQAVVGLAQAGLTFNNTDFHINNAIHDAFHNSGIFITTMNEAGSAVVNNPYCGPAFNARAALWVNASPGAVSIMGGQLVMGANIACQPILIDGSSGVSVVATIILESGTSWAAVGVNNSNNCRIAPTIKNRSVTAAKEAVYLSGTSANCIVEPIVMGKVGAFTIGVRIDGTALNNGVNGSGITAATCSTTKVQINGVNVVASGVSGGNTAYGHMT